jgi:hypothetical protein
MVYFIFVELYGKDTSLELTRYVLDIYKPSVAVDKLMAIYITGKVQYVDNDNDEDAADDDLMIIMMVILR